MDVQSLVERKSPHALGHGIRPITGSGIAGQHILPFQYFLGRYLSTYAAAATAAVVVIGSLYRLGEGEQI